MQTFVVMIEFDSTTVDAQGITDVRTGATEVVVQAPSPLAAEEQARATFAATATGTIITVHVRAQQVPP
jgi:hypothetical protein